MSLDDFFELDFCAHKYGTDKRTGMHGYTVAYHRHLSEMRGSCTRVLEIGVHGGASLQMWRDYFPRAQVHGIDIKPYTGASLGERITLHVADQGEAAALEEIAKQHGPFHLIVDDGSHENHHQKLAFETLWPFVKPGGCMIIEDVCCSYWSEYGNGNASSKQPGKTPVELFLDLVHDVNFRGFRVGRSNRRDAEHLLTREEEMPKDMRTDIEEIAFANSTIILRKRG